jgi:acetyl esterase/lipase
MLFARFSPLVLAALSSSAAHAIDPIEIPAFMAIPRPAPTAEVRYGAQHVQAIDVFVPTTHGPHPVAILIHGGCWSIHTAGREQLRHLGADLASRGVAVWSIGYRRANETSGGYPGTYEDVGFAIDLLRAEAKTYRLDLSRTVLVGHSAGGHLALWASARGKLPASSRLWTVDPFVPPDVISLAGIGDIKTSAALICGSAVAERLRAPLNPESQLDPYAEVSPVALPPPDSKITMISAILDRLVPPYLAYDYARAMALKGKPSIGLVNVPNAGHFDLVATGTHAWRIVRGHIEAALAISAEQ